MSELTSCNYCRFNYIKIFAKKNHFIVKTVKAPLGDWSGGVNVHVLKDGKEKCTEKNFKAWFAELTDRCVC